MVTIKPKADFLIEISHEVTNHIGGVYTVMVTKSREMKNYYGENYYAVGPYYLKSASSEFEEETPPEEIKSLFEDLEKNEKIICHYGRWLIPGSPKTFLIDFSKRLDKLRDIKRKMKSLYNVDCKVLKTKLKQTNITSPSVDTTDINLQLVWGDSTNIFIKNLLKLDEFKNKKGVLQFHFSDPSFTLIADLKKEKANVGLVVTSHSTRLGRAIVQNGENLYKEIRKNLKKNRSMGKKREYKYGSRNVVKHQFEVLGVKHLDTLTSVSEITAREVQYIFGRKVDLITPNGLEIGKMSSLEERSVLHHNAKNRLYRFLNAYFLPYYSIGIPGSLLFFTSGRYELTTKGFDILFEALGKLNDQLKEEDYKNNIFVFLFIMTTEGKKVNQEILENISIYDSIERGIEHQFPNMQKRIINNLIHDNRIDNEHLFDSSFLIDLKKLILKFRRKENENPPICAFKGIKRDDPVMSFLLKSGLDNKPDDKIKVIFYPAPVSVADGLLSMDYEEVINGMQVGVFPSIYEPWGYTPLESAIQGVISITTDVSGFGKFIIKNSDQRKKPGIIAINAERKKHEDIVKELVKAMYWVTKISRKKRIEKKMEAHRLATLADWKIFSQYYIKAHNLAVKKCSKRLGKK